MSDWLEDRTVTHKYRNTSTGELIYVEFKASEDKPDLIVQDSATYERIGIVPDKCHIQFIGASVQNAEYNPAFGQVVKNKYERSELCKKHGVEEIGNERPDTIRKEHKKTKESIRKERWNSVTKELGV